jgi:hypothetical protein
VEGFVVSVFKAENPDLHDFDMLVVVEERPRVGGTTEPMIAHAPSRPDAVTASRLSACDPQRTDADK